MQDWLGSASRYAPGLNGMAMAEQRFGKPPLNVNFVQRRGCSTAPHLVDQSVGRPGTYYADAIDFLLLPTKK